MSKPYNAVITIIFLAFLGPVHSSANSCCRGLLCWVSPQQSRAHCSSANRCSGLGLLCLQRPSHISSISSCSGWRLLHSPFQSWRALAENAIAKKKPPWAALRKNTWDRNENDEATQASAYTSVDGADDDDEPGEPWAAYTTEPTSLASPAGAYYDDDGKQTMAIDPDIGVWGGAWRGHNGNRRNRARHRPVFNRQNPQTSKTGNTTMSHYTLEASTQRGVQALSGTMEGARSVAGSNSGFNLAQRDSLGGAVFSSNNEAYGPTPGRANAVKDGERRSVAFTNIAPNSAATAGSGYGVVASAAGFEVASTARTQRLSEKTPTTLGSREPGKNGVLENLEKYNGRRLKQQRQRRLLLH